jgi:hypothetical protein
MEQAFSRAGGAFIQVISIGMLSPSAPDPRITRWRPSLCAWGRDYRAPQGSTRPLGDLARRAPRGRDYRARAVMGPTACVVVMPSQVVTRRRSFYESSACFHFHPPGIDSG